MMDTIKKKAASAIKKAQSTSKEIIEKGTDWAEKNAPSLEERASVIIDQGVTIAKSVAQTTSSIYNSIPVQTGIGAAKGAASAFVESTKKTVADQYQATRQKIEARAAQGDETATMLLETADTFATGAKKTYSIIKDIMQSAQDGTGKNTTNTTVSSYKLLIPGYEKVRALLANEPKNPNTKQFRQTLEDGVVIDFTKEVKGNQLFNSIRSKIMSKSDEFYMEIASVDQTGSSEESSARISLEYTPGKNNNYQTTLDALLKEAHGAIQTEVKGAMENANSTYHAKRQFNIPAEHGVQVYAIDMNLENQSLTIAVTPVKSAGLNVYLENKVVQRAKPAEDTPASEAPEEKLS